MYLISFECQQRLQVKYQAKNRYAAVDGILMFSDGVTGDENDIYLISVLYALTDKTPAQGRCARVHGTRSVEVRLA